MKTNPTDIVWDLVFWLWETPVTWGQVVVWILAVLVVDLIKHLFRLVFS